MNTDEYEIDETMFALGYDEAKSEVPCVTCVEQALTPD